MLYHFKFKALIFLVFFMILTMMPITKILSRDNPSVNSLRVNQERIEKRITELAQFGKTTDGGVNRVAFSEADLKARQYVMDLMGKLGLTVRVDSAGNIFGRRNGSDDKLPAIMLGSHIDTVPNGGKYDGALGVIAAIECIQILNENSIFTRHPLEVVVFNDEEGGMIGSLSLTGNMTDKILSSITPSGKTVKEGIQFVGGNPNMLDHAIRNNKDIYCYIELHVGQGCLTDKDHIDIGVVEGIVGIKWWNITVKGVSNHAGTTPMNKRKDALLAASHVIQTVNRVMVNEKGNHVGTVGKIVAEPGAPNVIPGKVLMSLEIRDLSEEKINFLFNKIKEHSKAIDAEFGTSITFSPTVVDIKPALMSKDMMNIFCDSAKDLGYRYKRMPSGAGHDGQNMAKIVPTGMIFIPSAGGISHSPKEFSTPVDMAKGANILLQSIFKIDGFKF